MRLPLYLYCNNLISQDFQFNCTFWTTHVEVRGLLANSTSKMAFCNEWWISLLQANGLVTGCKTVINFLNPVCYTIHHCKGKFVAAIGPLGSSDTYVHLSLSLIKTLAFLFQNIATSFTDAR